jgi:hypothetical protein
MSWLLEGAGEGFRLHTNDSAVRFGSVIAM